MNNLYKIAYPLVAVFALGAAFAVQAADGEGSGFDGNVTQNWHSAKTRAQVQVELQQARADNSINNYKVTYNPLIASKSYKSRSEVRAELIAARAAGYEENFREGSGAFFVARQPQRSDASHVVAGVGR